MTKKANVTNRAVAYIRGKILSGEWPLGSKLPSENQLCKELGCSRISIRSALQQFIAIGAIESIHGKGSFLRANDLQLLGQVDQPASYEAIMDLLDFAALTWPAICIKAAELADRRLLETLSEIVQQMRSLSLNEMSSLVRLVRSFHQSIALSLKNETLNKTFSAVFSLLEHSPCTGNLNTVYYGIIYHHNILLTAMESKDAKRIRLAVLDYFAHIKNDFYRNPALLEENAEVPQDQNPL